VDEHSKFTDTGNVENAVASQEDVQNLLKALQTGQGVDPSGFTGGSALRMQSLDGTLKNVTFSEKHLKAVKIIPQRPAYSTVEEYSVESAYGEEEGAYVSEIENPEEADPTLERKYAVVKFLRTLRKVGDVATMVKNIQAPVNVQTIAGTRFLLRSLEEGIFNGNAAFIPKQFDGMLALVTANANAENIVDMRNAELTQLDYADAAEIIANNYGSANYSFHSNGVQSSLDSSIEPDQRVILPVNPAQGIMIGTPTAGVRTSFGDIAFRPDVFIKEGLAKPAGAKGTGAPLAPTIALATFADTTAQFGAAIGDYIYAVTAITDKGESAPSAEDTQAIIADQGVRITVTKNGSGAVPQAYKVYRIQTNTDTVLKYMRTVAYSASPQDIDDSNEDIPGTSNVFVTDIDTLMDTIALKRLAPLTKVPLARVGAYIQWLQCLYITLQLTAPNKFVIFKNVKPKA
jgi:hypothetical protein